MPTCCSAKIGRHSNAGQATEKSVMRLSPNTICKHIRSLEERGLLVTEPTMVTTKDGCKRNGNLLFIIRPIQAALQQDYDRQMQKLTEDAARRKYADFIENTG